MRLRSALISAMIICAVLPAAASASTVWEVHEGVGVWKVLPAGTPLTVGTSGNLTFKNYKGSTLITTIKCSIIDSEEIENVAGSTGVLEGIDRMTEFRFVTCTGTKNGGCPTGTALSLNAVLAPVWTSKLVEIAGIKRDEINAEVQVLCNNAVFNTLSGVLTPSVTVNKLNFQNVGGGSLAGGGVTSVVAGSDALAPPAPYTKVR